MASAVAMKVPFPFRVIQSFIIVGGGTYLSSRLFPRDVEVSWFMTFNPQTENIRYMSCCSKLHTDAVLYLVTSFAECFVWCGRSHIAPHHAPNGPWRCTQSFNFHCKTLPSPLSQGEHSLFITPQTHVFSSHWMTRLMIPSLGFGASWPHAGNNCVQLTFPQPCGCCCRHGQGGRGGGPPAEPGLRLCRGGISHSATPARWGEERERRWRESVCNGAAVYLYVFIIVSFCLCLKWKLNMWWQAFIYVPVAVWVCGWFKILPLQI